MRGSDLCVIHSGRIARDRRVAILPRVPAGSLVAAVEASRGVPRHLSQSAERAFYRAKRSGRLTLDMAETLAHELLDEHPASIWGEAWWEATGAG